MKNKHLFKNMLPHRQVLLLTRVCQQNAFLIERKNWSHQSFHSTERKKSSLALKIHRLDFKEAKSKSELTNLSA